jgi:hypothetical protein
MILFNLQFNSFAIFHTFSWSLVVVVYNVAHVNSFTILKSHAALIVCRNRLIFSNRSNSARIRILLHDFCSCRARDSRKRIISSWWLASFNNSTIIHDKYFLYLCLTRSKARLRMSISFFKIPNLIPVKCDERLIFVVKGSQRIL